ncbi:ORF6N domain-containing protein [Xenorhabdus szentirmaii]|uniref:ORF6N domain-containing protein n=1 Tax=Xenorhabdus szentirmaii TaxID=290112 RepID=UPI0019964157|nr:ORF6N domain-containing protein [Xenorhabdus sp. 5]MBD2826692.1 ORF6N domain-containing protein [Xenorhabdus sp. 5]
MLSIPLNKLTKNSFSIEHIIAIIHNGIPVITTELLAGVYETDVNNIQQNFKRNKDRFVEGKHFIKLTGLILKEFKNRLTNCQLVGKNARSLTLWTERGAARHAKMLDTDKAWDVFEKLEDFYFNQKESETQKKPQSPQFRYIARLEVYDKHLNKTEVFTGGTNTPAGIVKGVARKYGYHIDNMVSLPINMF